MIPNSNKLFQSGDCNGKKKVEVQITIYETLHRKQTIQQRNISETCFNMIWMHYIFKYVQLYIQVLRIS
jgi:hypothetical protein